MARRPKGSGFVRHASQQRWPIEPIEVLCDYCGKPAVPTKGSNIWPSRPELSLTFFYCCDPCGARVGTHKGTWQPLGRLANADLRRLRQEAHAVFDPICHSLIPVGGKRQQGREAGYRWLAEQLGLTRDTCHVGLFDDALCRRAIEVCTNYGKEQRYA